MDKMDRRKIVNLIVLNFGLAMVNILLFSPGLIGLQLGGTNIFITAFASAIIFLDIAIFTYANYLILTKRRKVVAINEIKTSNDFVDALKEHKGNKTFEKNVKLLLDQIERVEKKKEMISDILLQQFNKEEMSFRKFEGVISKVEKIFFMNIRSIINKLNAFDEDDYTTIKKENASATFSKAFLEDKLSVHQEYISFVKMATEENEQILLKLDKLLLEISSLDSIDTHEIEQMSEMIELDDLIKNTKYYK